MQALGLRLEENGTVLALRGKGESAGTQWETVPHDVLQSLDAAAKVKPLVEMDDYVNNFSHYGWVCSCERMRTLTRSSTQGSVVGLLGIILPSPPSWPPHQELAMQVYGIDHPEVADLTAVSAAVARLRNASGRSVPHLRCVETVTRYLGNALDNPTVGKVWCTC